MNQFEQEKFLKEKREAIERMMDLNRRSASNEQPHKMPPAPSFVRVNSGGGFGFSQTEKAEHKSEDFKKNAQNKKADCSSPSQKQYKHEKPNDFSAQNGAFDFSKFLGGNLPLLNSLKSDSDMALISALVLLLSNENADRMLILALLYILL